MMTRIVAERLVKHQERSGFVVRRRRRSEGVRPCRVSLIAVGTLIAERPPHRTVRAGFPHRA